MRIYVRDWHGRFAEVPGGKRLKGLISVKTDIYGKVRTADSPGFGKLSGRTVFPKSKFERRITAQPKKISTNIAVKTNIYGKVRTRNDADFGKLSGRTVFPKSSLTARPAPPKPKRTRATLISVKTDIYGKVKTRNDPAFGKLSGKTVFQKSTIDGRGMGVPAGKVGTHDGRGPKPRKPKEPPKPTIAPFAFAAIRDREPVRQELERQAALTPKTMKRLREVTDRPGTQDEQAGMNALAYYQPGDRRIHMRPHLIPDKGDRFSQPERGVMVGGRRRLTSWHTPCGHSHTGLQATLAHEYGHHVTWMMEGLLKVNTRGTFRDGQWSLTQKEIARRQDWVAFNNVLREEFGVDRFHKGRRERMPDQVMLDVSEYGATNQSEMLAEIWAEYSTNPNARPKIKRVGKLMQELAEKYESNIPKQAWEDPKWNREVAAY